MIYALDIFGTFAFAISGALVASKRNFDLFGIVIVAFVSAAGGGTTRDLLMDIHPVFWFGDLNYLWTTIAAVVFTYFLKKNIYKLNKTMILFDAIGLGVFTFIGVHKGFDYNLSPVIAIIIGMISGAMGGVIRDVLTGKVPLIFKKEIYASACLLGGIVFYISTFFETNQNLQAYATILTVIIIRMSAVKYDLHLPKI